MAGKRREDFVAVLGHDCADFAVHVARQIGPRLLELRSSCGRQRAERGGAWRRTSTTSSAITLSTVLPCQIERAPAELLPIMPPTLARLLVATSGPNCRPCARGRGIELVEHDARLHARGARCGIDLDRGACTC